MEQLRTYPKKNKYAVIISSSDGLKWGVNAFLNGFEQYGNTADIFLIETDFDKNLLREFSQFSFPVIPIDLSKIEEEYCHSAFDGVYQNISSKLMFYRWYFAKDIGLNYDAVLVVDADMVCINNLMKYFRIAEKSGFFLAPDNLCGFPMENFEFEEKQGYSLINGVQGAASPPMMSVPAFFDAKKFQEVFDKMRELAIREGKWSDITWRFRSFYELKKLEQVLLLPNQFWVQTVYYYPEIKKQIYSGQHCLFSAGSRINIFHGKWWSPLIIKHFLDSTDNTEAKEIAKNNLKLFFLETKRLNLEGKVKLDFNFELPKEYYQ